MSHHPLGSLVSTGYTIFAGFTFLTGVTIITWFTSSTSIMSVKSFTDSKSSAFLGSDKDEHRCNSRPSGQLLTKEAINGTEQICNMYLHRTESDQYNTRAPVPAGSAPTPRSPRGPQHHRCPTRVVRRQVATYVPAPRLSFPLLWLTHRDLD